MPLIPVGEAREIPWKNGGGVMRDIAAHPPSAGFEDFVWRVSLARITSDGPFSVFPGVDRLFVPVEGDGLELEVEGVAHHMGSAPLAFSGEAPVYARLGNGPVVALNVMTRRGSVRASIELLEAAQALEIAAACETWVLLALAGGADIETREERGRLGVGDAWLGAGPARILPAPTWRAALASLRRPQEADA
jgi:environmental stress-induced protein Ves